MPSAPRTLLNMVAMPQVRTCAPQVRFSGLAEGPRPGLVTVGVGKCMVDFFPMKLGKKSYLITGVTRDSAGVALPGCTVKLYTSTDDVERYQTVSDANGAFSFSVPSNGWAFYAVAYLAGAPDVAGTTVNTLFGA